MAGKSLFQITKQPPSAARQYQTVQDEVRKSLVEVGQGVQNRFNYVVANWVNKPKFKVEVGSGKERLFLRVTVEGPNRAKLIYKWVDKGTKPHTIQPNKASKLRFATGYQAKTGVGGKYGGPGRANGPVVFTKLVNHPGIKARNFSDTIAKDTEPILKREVNNGYRRGLRKAPRGQ